MWRAARAVLRRAGLASLVASVAVLAGCLGRGDFRCADHGQCGTGAFCESNGHCSRRDVECPSRRRFVHHAGNDGDACVPDFCSGNPIRAMTAGGAHACVLRGDGSVACWGRNDDGQLGDETRTPRSLPVTVAGVGAAIAVAAGQRHSCAVRIGGAVVCWGANDAGQLGNGVGPSTPVPMLVAGVTGAVSVAAGADFSCAVLGDGTVRCWGADDVGQLGDDGLAATTRLPSPVAFLDGVRSVSAFWQHACAIRSDETLWCWGANTFGQVGNGTTVDQRRPVRVLALMFVTGAGTGLSHSCAVTRAAGLYCWGDNSASQLGSTLDGPVTAPSRVPIVSDPIGVAVGLQHTCAIRNSGAVYCWGQNDRGQLGQQGTSAILSSPVAIAGLETGAALVAGAAFSCARTVDGAMFCWGDNHHGQLAIGSGSVQPRPVAVPNVVGATRISAGAAHTCAAVSGDGGTIPLCWGADPAGQLGDASTTDRARAGPIMGDIKASAIAAGGAHTCAIDALDTQVWCWGRGNAGQLGSTPLVDKPPSQVPALTGVTAIAAGGAHTCAIAAGAVHCFGANANGQLGDGTTADRATPPTTTALGTPAAPAAEIAAGDAHTCAVDGAGKVWCWGRGDEGQLGDGGSDDRPAPVAVALGAVTARPGAIAAGSAHTCAVTAAGELACWGRDDRDQLGPATAAPSTPRIVAGVSDARAVAAGGAHTCAIAGDARRVWCFGANDHGQLGTGDITASREMPVAIPGLEDVQEITAGAIHSCARRADGTLACWGGDTSGQLGDGVALTVGLPQLARITCD